MLPAWAQNVALSIYGANIYKQRFYSDIPAPYRDNLNLFDEPNCAQFTQQNLRLQHLLTHCKDYVPYYKKFLEDIDISTITVDTLKNVVPVLTKSDVIKNAEQLVSAAPVLQKKLRTANTSGSSGTPLCVRYTDEARRINYQFYESVLKEFGCTYQSKSTTFAGRILYKQPGRHPARYDHYNRTQYLSSYFISATTIESYVSALNNW